MNLYSNLAKIRKWMKHGGEGRFYRILEKIGLVFLVEHFLRYLFSFWYHRNPTPKMKNERKIFSEHAQELKMVYESLEDDKSRFVFENILKYRITFDWAYLKKARAKDNLSTQYFVSEVLFSDHEVIVNCGANRGESTILFYENIPGCRVIALEPEEKNFEFLQKLKLEGLKTIQAGVWSEDTTLRFSDQGGGTSDGSIDTAGNTEIIVKALDHISECQSATYIKMDIEGAELEALKGAEEIIRKQRPKLAICIYHRPEDFFEIPLYIKKLNPDYKLFIHHHNTIWYWETVLYAV